MRDLLYRVDRALGDGVERLVRDHHHRRLRRIGWSHALDPPDDGSVWASGDPRPRAGNAVDVLVDGATMLPRLARELRRAQSHVHLAGWFLSPHFALVRDGERVELRALLAELAERIPVRVLVWAGAPLPLFRPSRGDVATLRHALTWGTRIRFGADSKERPMHCHHEKIAVVDDRVAFVGGIDVTSYEGDRYDDSSHRARGRLGWHDVAAEIRGPAVADVAEHFRLRWRETTGEELPPPAAADPAGDVTLQVVRTVPEHVYDALPHGDFRILEAYARALRSAERLVYVENQFIWSPEVSEILEAKLRDPPSDDFRVVLVLPAKPNEGGDDTRGQLGDLLDADGGAGRVLGCTIRALGPEGPGPVYVHAKVTVVDDRWLTLGSANLNEHSLFNDTELNLVTCDAALARAVRLRLWSEHLERPVAEIDGDPTHVVDDVWRPIALEQHARRARGEPPTHRLTLLPNVSKRSGRLLGPIQGIVVDG